MPNPKSSLINDPQHPDTRTGRAGQFTDARKQAENRLALLARGPAKKKPSSKGAGEKRPTKVTISEDEAPKKKKAKPSVPEGSNGSNGAHGLPPDPPTPRCFPRPPQAQSCRSFLPCQAAFRLPIVPRVLFAPTPTKPPRETHARSSPPWTPTVAAPASSSAAPAAPAPASSSALVKPSAGGDAPAAVKTKGGLKKKTSLGGGGGGEAAPFHKLAASVAAGADSGKVHQRTLPPALGGGSNSAQDHF